MDYVWRAPFTTPIAAPTQENDSESICAETGVGNDESPQACLDFAEWMEDANLDALDDAGSYPEPPPKIELLDASTQTNWIGEYPLRILF